MKATPWKALPWIVCALALVAVPAAAQPTELFISEYIEGSSNNKAIEIYNGTGAAIDLAAGGYSIQMFFNGNPAAGLTINLTGTVAAGDVFVIAHSSANATILAQADQTNGAGWFNGDDAVVLRKGAAIVDAIGQAGFDPGSQWGAGLVSTADNTLRRMAAVTAGDSNATDVFDPAPEWDGFATDTFDGLGSHNAVVPPPVITTQEIWAIQGSGPVSPFVGQTVLTENNIVTALGYGGAAANGFFIQAPDARADGSDQTSNGIFVFTGGVPPVSVGDQVDVTATVAEFFNMTELTGPAITIDSSGNALPAAVPLAQVAPGVFVPSHDQPWPANELERFEGMLVRVENGRVTAPTDRFGDAAIVADSTRAFREPGIEYPGVAGYPIVWDGNPEIFEINPDGAGLPNVALAAGSAIQVAEGPLAFSFSDYQIWPTTFTYTEPALPRAVRARHPGELTVASQNLLRFFDADPTNGPDDGPVMPAEYQDRLAKASLHIRTVLGAPDVLALAEVENIGALNDLAARIAVDDATLVYTGYLLEGNDIGGIDTGFLVRNTVTVNSLTQVGKDTTLSLDGSLLNDRPPLVLDADYTGNGAAFPITVIGVHGRSLSGIEGGSAGANRVRQKRLEQALELANYIQARQIGDPARRIIVVGDFNAFEFSDGYVDVTGIISGNLDPNGAIQHDATVDVVAPDLVDQALTLPASERYSFVFGGSAQLLDHTLTTQNLSDYLRGLQFARGNADAPVALQTDPSTPLAASDHDGEVLFVMTDADADGLPDDVDACPASPPGMFITIGACNTGIRDQMLANGCTISETFARLGDTAKNHGQFVSAVSHLATAMRQDGLFDTRAHGAIVSCAARANVP